MLPLKSLASPLESHFLVLTALMQTMKIDGFGMKVQRMHGRDLSEASPYATRPLAFQARVSYLKITQTKL